jgi:hypothetical protein
MRVPQLKEKPKGSQKWLQEIINTCPDCLNRLIQKRLTSLSGRKICWISPLKHDDYAEYRDAAFLDQLGLTELSEKLNHFWPRNGPQWDALGKTSDDKAYILIEAKANVPELVSFCGAKDKVSLKTISERLNETQRWLNCGEPCIDWKCGFYQYANRLAHLYFLREKAQIEEAYLVFLYFVEDFSHILTSQDAWSAALKLQKKLMGLSAGNLTDKVIDLFININELCLIADH